jgi:hypothetical protein
MTGVSSEPTCGHEPVIAERVLFVGTEGARLCELCERLDVLLQGRWTRFEEYLELRRRRRVAELGLVPTLTPRSSDGTSSKRCRSATGTP